MKKCKCGCDKEIRVKPHHKYYGTPDYISGHNAWNKGLTNETDDRVKKCSETRSGKKRSEKARKLMRQARLGKSPWNKGLTKNDPRMLNIIKNLKPFIPNGIPWNKSKRHKQKTLEKISLKSKNAWKNPEYIKKQIKARNIKNKAESVIEKLLNEILPNEYKYAGLGTFILENKNPDFININGQKKIIEHFGTYWHCDPLKYKENDYNKSLKKSAKEVWAADREKIEVYTKHGYKTLIIWEHELTDLEKLKIKILEFNGDTIKCSKY